MTQNFKYDTLGNIIEFYVIDLKGKSQKKESHQKYKYTYDKNGHISTMIRQTLLPKEEKGKVYYKYNNRYW